MKLVWQVVDHWEAVQVCRCVVPKQAQVYVENTVSSYHGVYVVCGSPRMVLGRWSSKPGGCIHHCVAQGIQKHHCNHSVTTTAIWHKFDEVTLIMCYPLNPKFTCDCSIWLKFRSLRSYSYLVSNVLQTIYYFLIVCIFI